MTTALTLLLALATPPAVAAPDADEAKRPAISRAQQRKQSKAEARDLSLLQRSATLYWEGVRWNDADKAGKFIEHPGTRLEFEAWLDERNSERKIIDVKIVGLSVESIEEKGSAVGRIAELRVSIEGYTVPEQVLKKTVEEQRWYRTVNGWWVEWAPPQSPAAPTD